MTDRITFTIRVEQRHRRYTAWIDGHRDNTEVSHPTRHGAVVKLADRHLDDTEPAPPVEENTDADSGAVNTNSIGDE